MSQNRQTRNLKNTIIQLLRMSLIVVVVSFALPASVRADTLYGWMQYNTKGMPLARVITNSLPCPAFSHDAGNGTMTQRGTTPPPLFDDIYVCEAELPAGATDINAGGLPLPPPKTNLQNVVVLGDTGCRVKGGDLQNCTGDGTGPAWNYEGIADAAAAQNAELIVHVGDMHYREYGTCGANCVQSNIGYSWASWEADFFAPSQVLFASAPWIFVRGNHEDCTRAWKGWFYFLDPRPLPSDPWQSSDCKARKEFLYSNPYAVTFENKQIIVMDSSYIHDDYARAPEQHTVTQYAG